MWLRDLSSCSKEITWILFSVCFRSFWNIPRNTRESGVGRRQFHARVNEFILFIFYHVTLSLIMVFDLFFIAWQWKQSLKFAMACSTKFQPSVVHCQRIQKWLQCVWKRFQRFEKCCNAFSMHFSTHFQCIFNLSLTTGFIFAFCMASGRLRTDGT